MADYYVPSTKKELIMLIKRGYWSRGVSVNNLQDKTKKQLYAIFHNLRRRQTDIQPLIDGLV